MKEDNTWRRCYYCGKYISLHDIQDHRKVKDVQCESYGGWYDPPEYWGQPAHIKCITKNKGK